MVSTPAKRNALSLISGPPTEPPNWFRRRMDGLAPSKKFRASRASLRKFFNKPAWKDLAAALGDNADLSAASGAELRRIIAGVHAELLHILHAGLQPEETPKFTANVARVVADDAAGFNSIQPYRV